jgi:uncharacterized membrane protein
MGRRKMLIAVNREIRTMPKHVRDSATAELARQLAREFDAGDRPAATPLMRALDQLRKLAAPPKSAPEPTEEPEDAPDELDELARARTDRLARAAGVVRSLGADHRRSGGRASG